MGISAAFAVAGATAYSAHEQGQAADAAADVADRASSDTIQLGREQMDLSRDMYGEYMTEARRQYDQNYALLGPLAQGQADIMREQLKQGRESYDYAKTFRPLEQDMLGTISNWRQTLEAKYQGSDHIRDVTLDNAATLRTRADWHDAKQMEGLDLLTGGNRAIMAKYGADIENDVGTAVADARAGQAQAMNSAVRQAMRYGINVPTTMTDLGAAGASQIAAAANSTRTNSINNYRSLVAQGLGQRDQSFRTSQTAFGDAMNRQEGALLTKRANNLQDEAIIWGRGMDMAGLGRGMAGLSQGSYGLASSAGSQAAQTQTASGSQLLGAMGQGIGQYLNGMSQGANTATAGRQMALQGLQFGNTGTDLSGIGSAIGGLARIWAMGGLGGAGGGVAGSSRAYKQNIVRVGTHPCGVGLYAFEYRDPYRAKWGGGRHIGVLADELAAVMPSALSIDDDGHTVVDYSML